MARMSINKRGSIRSCPNESNVTAHVRWIVVLSPTHGMHCAIMQSSVGITRCVSFLFEASVSDEMSCARVVTDWSTLLFACLRGGSLYFSWNTVWTELKLVECDLCSHKSTDQWHIVDHYDSLVVVGCSAWSLETRLRVGAPARHQSKARRFHLQFSDKWDDYSDSQGSFDNVLIILWHLVGRGAAVTPLSSSQDKMRASLMLWWWCCQVGARLSI